MSTQAFCRFFNQVLCICCGGELQKLYLGTAGYQPLTRYRTCKDFSGSFFFFFPAVFSLHGESDAHKVLAVMKSCLCVFPLVICVLGVMSIVFIKVFLLCVTKQVSAEPGRVSEPGCAHHQQQRHHPCPADGAAAQLPHLSAITPEACTGPAAASALSSGGAGQRLGRGRQGRAPSPGLMGPSFHSRLSTGF